MKAILLNRIILVLAFVGLFIAGTLSIEAATGAIVPCGAGSNGCELVARHPSSRIAGVPVAYLGVIGYLLIGGLAILRASKGVHNVKTLVNAGYAVAAIGTVMSLYLQYVSFMVIQAKCLWCISSAVLMILLLVVHAMLAQELETNSLTPDVKPGFGKLDVPLIAVLPVLVGIGLVTMGMTMQKGSTTSIPMPQGVDFSKVALIPANANSYGDKNAPVTIVEFADILCPSCQQTSPAVKEFVAQNVGKIRLVYRHYPLVSLHPRAMDAAAISEGAADQGKFWDFVLAVMGKQMKPETADELFEAAQAAGIDTNTIRERLTNKNDPIYERLDRDMKAVKALGLNSTPTFFIVTSEGKILETAGPGDILPKLNGDTVKQAMNAKPAASSSTSPTPETKP